MKGLGYPRLTALCGAQFAAMGVARRWPRAVLLVLAAAAVLGGCASTTRAPVVDRARASSTYHGDWRPATYTVEKGDTLWGIALEFGLDYKDLAAWNGIGSGYGIKSGQLLRLTPPRQTAVTTPLETEAPVAGVAVASATFIKSQPKAVKLPYSKQALLAARARPSRTVAAAPRQMKAGAREAAAAMKKAGGRGRTMNGSGPVAWRWPARGKVVGRFDDANGAKGIDIAGKMGQPVFAAAAGKVVYSGSGLRGYGKLIIIKHNKTYLSAYAHNSRLLVKEGQNVAKGQKIAKMGDSGSNRVELHFEIRRLGKPVNPLKYLRGNGHP